MGSNPIWGSDFLRVLQTFNLSCICCFIVNMYCEIIILNNFRGTGVDADNNGETENNGDKLFRVAIASLQLVIWMHNSPKLPF